MRSFRDQASNMHRIPPADEWKSRMVQLKNRKMAFKLRRRPSEESELFSLPETSPMDTETEQFACTDKDMIL